MKRSIVEFMKRLKHTTVMKPNATNWDANADIFYERVYDMARLMHLYPNYRALLTDDDKSTLKECFEPTLASVVGFTPCVVNNIEAYDMNVAKRRLSELTFLKDEVLGLYREVSGGIEASENTKKALAELDYFIEMLDDQIYNWSLPTYEFARDDPRQVPNLNGVPESHTWWTKKHRDYWKEKSEC